MEARKYKRYRFSGFTLVELIVVITILAILGTISFTSLTGYQGQARDSLRIDTLSMLKNGLELSQVNTGQFPSPDGITSSGSVDGKILIYVGEIQSRISSLIHMNQAPKDPLSNSYYAYGTDADYNYYQVATVLENPMAYGTVITPTYADNGYTARVIGNYDGLLKSGTGIYNLPSLIFTGSGNLLASTAYFIANKQANIPYRIGDQINLTPKTTEEILSVLTNGLSQTLTGKTLPKTQEELVSMSTDLSALGYSIDTIGSLVLGKQYVKIAVAESCLLGDGTTTGGTVDNCSL